MEGRAGGRVIGIAVAYNRVLRYRDGNNHGRGCVEAHRVTMARIQFSEVDQNEGTKRYAKPKTDHTFQPFAFELRRLCYRYQIQVAAVTGDSFMVCLIWKGEGHQTKIRACS